MSRFSVTVYYELLRVRLELFGNLAFSSLRATTGSVAISKSLAIASPSARNDM